MRFRRSKGTDDETAAAMHSLAEAFRTGAAAQTDVGLGWGEADAAVLDALAEAFVRSGPTADVRHSMIMSMGAYLGELIVRHSGGRWCYDGKRRAAVVETPGGLRGYPHNKVAKKLDGGVNRDLLAFYVYAVRGEVLPDSVVSSG